MYKLFLSYSLSESAVAKELYTQLNNAFMGNLVFFLRLNNSLLELTGKKQYVRH